MKTLMIYGATGYTGSMIVQHVLASGISVIIAGRNKEKLAAMANDLNLPFNVFTLEDPSVVDQALAGVTVLLNCAGPFFHTADVLIKAAVRNQVHYLDIAAEHDSYRLAEAYDSEASAEGVMLLPGCGGSVAMLGCLARHAADRVKSPRSISLALNVTGSMSRGSAVSALENLSPECLARLNGQLVPTDPKELRSFDFGKGARECFPVTLPDLITVWRATGIPDIATFVHVSGNGFPQGDLSAIPDGPSAEERASNRYQAAAEVVDAEGKRVRMLLDTVNGYSFTALAATEAARRVLSGLARSGFITPVELFGKGFAESIADTSITDGWKNFHSEFDKPCC
ncbi:saccharopine dehydrogenase family protein [Pantoea sp. USHLN256]|uniref:saccharopine dehydrogenase family protein n=1 Tax=Pantoea sp. USHLN256 TaxID=3081293 RepID=UPI0030173E21